MRILHLDSGRQMRGGQWQVLYLLEGLKEAGVACTLLARAGSPLLAAAISEGFTAKPLTLLTLNSIAGEHDLIHAHDARSHTLALAAPQRPLVVARRVAFPVRASWLSQWKYARACRYIAVSGHVQQTLLDAGVPAEKIAVIPDAVTARPRSAAARDIILSLDFDDPMKGAALVRQAAALAGLDVHFSRDLMQDLDRAAIFVYITYEEGLGSAVLQAMAAGVPVIASRIGGIPEAVEDGVTGLLVNNDAAEISAAMLRLVHDTGLAAALGSAARHRAASRFALPLVTRRTIEIYEEALKCSRS